MRSIMIVLAFCLASFPAWAADADAAAKGSKVDPNAPDTWYARTRVATEFGTITNHYWSKGPRLRAETVLAGHPIVTIVGATHYYVYDMLVGKGVAIERSEVARKEDKERGRPFGRELDDLIEAGGEKIHDGPAREGGLPYQVYQLTNTNGRRRVVVTGSEPPLPIRIETFVRSSGDKGTLEYAGWQRALPIEDSFFAAPQAVAFERLTYAEYLERASRGSVGPAPIYYRDLLHGKKKRE